MMLAVAKSSLMNHTPLKTKSSLASCPACGLLCDDVLVENTENIIKVLANSCTKNIAFFEQAFIDTSPKIAGNAVSLEAAITQAAELLKLAKQPLFAGLSTDISGFRSLFSLAQKTNATLQHINATSMARNIKVLQSTGWQTTTLTEVKNRADVIVCIGTNIVAHNPRFFERFVWVKNALFTDVDSREVIYIGGNLDISAGTSPNIKPPSLLACKAIDLPEVTAVLRALVLNKKLKETQVAGIKISDLRVLADKLKQAKYAVLTWVAKDLDFPHAELTIQNITETVAVLNQTTRAAGLPLGGSDGDTSANNAKAWLSGLTLNDDAIEHDCVIWVNSFSLDKVPPTTNYPLIVLGHINTLPATPSVFIPIATPGLDCSGTLFRVDGSVTLPLKQLRESNLPTLGEVVRRIEALLR